MTSFGVLHGVRFTSSNLFQWQNWEITSDHFFSKFLSGLIILANFSFKQRLHFFKVGLWDLYCPLISHVSLRVSSFCFKVQYSIDKVVSVLELVKLNDFLWFAQRLLNVVSQIHLYLLFLFTIAAFYSSLI